MITNLKIDGLFEDTNIDLEIKDNVLIITGDNGNGKTTILNILYNGLIGNLVELNQYKFKSIKITFSENFKEMNCITIKKNSDKYNRISEVLFSYNYDFEEGQKNTNIKFQIDDENNFFAEMTKENSLKESFLSNDLLYEFEKDEDVSDIIDALLVFEDDTIFNNLYVIKKSLLYFPTYRRIDIDMGEYLNENFELKNYNFRNSDRRVIGISNSDISEKLQDYSRKINSFQSENLDIILKSFVKEFISKAMDSDEKDRGMTYEPVNTKKEVIHERLTNINNLFELEFPKEEINAFSDYYFNQNRLMMEFIKRVQGDSKMNKNLPKNIVQILSVNNPWAGYLKILEDLFENYQSEFNNELYPFDFISKNIEDFTRKKISLVKMKNNDFEIEKRGKKISFKDLSTGEKQIFTFFVYCALELDIKRPSLVIIDEPEISLHIKWQSKLLNSLLAFKNINVVTATHSPYVISKELRKNVVSFIEDEDDYDYE